MKKRLFSLFVALLLLAAVLPVGFAESDVSAPIAILYTGDVHCGIEDNLGYAGVAALKKSLVEAGCEVLLVDTGDAIQGAPIGMLTSGESLIKIMNELGYSAMALGNHEFDYGMDNLLALKEVAEFPLLSCNLTDIASGETLFDPYVIVEAAGKKIAFVGVTTPLTITSSTPTYFMNDSGEYIYEFRQDETAEVLWACVQSAVDAARAEGAEYVIALAHLGSDASASQYNSKTLIASTTGIDVVFDGHSHSVIECQRLQNKEGDWVRLSSTGTKLANVGFLLLDDNGISTGLVSSVPEKDEATTAFIADIMSEFSELLDQVAITTGYDLIVNDPATGNRLIRTQETNLGDLVTDAYRSIGEAEIAFANGGGIRADLKAGDVTFGDLLTVLPFGNQVSVIKATGQQILDALEFGARKLPEQNGGFLQVSGLTYEIHSYLPTTAIAGEDGMFGGIEGEYRVKNVKVGGEPLELDREYTLAGLGYTLQQSGDGFSMFAGCEVLRDSFIMDYDAFAQYVDEYYAEMVEAYAEPYGEERIVIVDVAK